MMSLPNIILFDTASLHKQLLPLTFTRACCDLRLGILTLREKWEMTLQQPNTVLTEKYLECKYPKIEGDSLFISGNLLPDESISETVGWLKDGEALYAGQQLLAFRTSKAHINTENIEAIAKGMQRVDYMQPVKSVHQLWDIFRLNDAAIRSDFTLLTRGRKSQVLSSTNQLLGDSPQLFIEEGARVECSTINVETGPVYIAADAEVMEGCMIRGPFALGEHATLKMGAKIYGATTLGLHCKVGGEVNNSVFFGFSNKAHDGFIGNSVIGEWCNLGADTNNSNLKNNYSNVEVWSYKDGKAIDSGSQFCGLFMGDHSKSGINTMFNTGTVVGVSANIFGSDFPPKFIPSFSWGGAAWLRTFSFEKSIEVAQRMMERRGLQLSNAELQILQHIYDAESVNRNFKNK